MHFLDSLPFDLSSEPARELWVLLADTYHNSNQIVVLLRQAGIRPSSIDLDGPADLVWADVLTKGRNQNRLRALMEVVATSDDAAVAARIEELTGPKPPTRAGMTTVPLLWKGALRNAEDERRIREEPTLLDVAFLRRGTELSAAVCRLLVTLPSAGRVHGTAFRIGEQRLLTNHHVLFGDAQGTARAVAVEAWFGYERTFEGADLEHDVLTGLPQSIVGSRTHDWAVIELIEPLPNDIPIIPLGGGVPPGRGDRVYIIQHPFGGPKQIGMIHNEVRHVDADVVQYWTDTEGGSSGSPVFDERWRLVALHRRYVTVPTGGSAEVRNEGVRIERVAEALRAAGGDA